MAAEDRNQEQGSGAGTKQDGSRTSGKNVSAEPAPNLSERGGIEPKQTEPSQYNDRTRDRELDEG